MKISRQWRKWSSIISSAWKNCNSCTRKNFSWNKNSTTTFKKIKISSN